MARPKFLADNDFNQQVVDGVLRREPLVEFVRLRHIGLGDMADPDVLAWAAERGYIILSHDVNTMRGFAYERVARGEPMAGLLLAHQREPAASIIESVLLIWADSESEEWGGQSRSFHFNSGGGIC
jgi:predicted nuclease of predicted toxin-antitoxin system